MRVSCAVLLLGLGAALGGYGCFGDSTDGWPPIAPTGVGAQSGQARVRISWTPVAYADSYNIYWSTTPGVTSATGTPILNIVSPYDHISLPGGVTHFYVVTAVSRSWESPESMEVSATPGFAGPPGSPTGVVAVAGDAEATIYWPIVLGASLYDIYWDTNPGVTIATGTRVPGAPRPFTHAGLANGMTYYYVVTARNTFGDSAESAEVSASPFAGGPVTASVDIVGAGTVTFAIVDHYHDRLWPGPGIRMENSTPPGYTIDIHWIDPVTDPGCPFDTCVDPLRIIVMTPAGHFWENPCVTDLTLCVMLYAPSPGGSTVGTFSGEVEEVSTGSPILTLQNGAFTARRNY